MILVSFRHHLDSGVLLGKLLLCLDGFHDLFFIEAQEAVFLVKLEVEIGHKFVELFHNGLHFCLFFCGLVLLVCQLIQFICQLLGYNCLCFNIFYVLLAFCLA